MVKEYSWGIDGFSYDFVIKEVPNEDGLYSIKCTRMGIKVLDDLVRVYGDKPKFEFTEGKAAGKAYLRLMIKYNSLRYCIVWHAKQQYYYHDFKCVYRDMDFVHAKGVRFSIKYNKGWEIGWVNIRRRENG